MPFGVILDMLQIRLEQRAHFYIKLQLDQADAMPENKNWLAFLLSVEGILQTLQMHRYHLPADAIWNKIRLYL